MGEFQLFGFQHFVALLAVVLTSAAAFGTGRSRYAKVFALLGGLFFAVYGIVLWTYKLLDGLDLDYDLPFQLCDLVFIFCLICFFSPRPLLLTLTTYWGLAGTLQALITPDVQQAFPSSEFIIFFVGHSAIVIAVFFLLGRSPHPKLAGLPGFRTAFLYLLLYTVVTCGINKVLGVNYGYLCEKPRGASVLDAFGPWPAYIFAGLGIALVLFLLIAGALKLLPLSSEKQ